MDAGRAVAIVDHAVLRIRRKSDLVAAHERAELFARSVCLFSVERGSCVHVLHTTLTNSSRVGSDERGAAREHEHFLFELRRQGLF